MISIIRAKKIPKKLNDTNRAFKVCINGMNKRQAYKFYLDNENKYRYNTDETKEKFKRMTYHRCSFCTKYISDFNDAMTVEHIMLKRDYPNKIFQWSNLLCSCDICNTKRSTKPYIKAKYLDPTQVINIEQYFEFKLDGHIDTNKSLSPTEIEKAEYMIELYQLNRDELVCDRRDFITDLMNDDEFYEILKRKNNSNQSIIFLSVFTYYRRSKEKYGN